MSKRKGSKGAKPLAHSAADPHKRRPSRFWKSRPSGGFPTLWKKHDLAILDQKQKDAVDDLDGFFEWED